MMPQNSKKSKSFDGGLKSIIDYNNSIKPNSGLLKTLKIALPQFFEKDVYDENGNLVKNGDFKTDKFLDELKSNNITESRDGYKLAFVGKEYARLQTGCLSETMIVPDTEHNSQKENANSGNVFITGDNLEALRHLQNAYTGKIKMIYIDPPYNTGSDNFTYNDKFEFTDEQLKSALGYDDNEIARLKSLQGKCSHSAWMTFMYPRLKLAQKLLTDDGVIFVSIDDNEQANLKLLMDDILGEGNFVAVFNWQTKKAAQGMTTENMIVDNHEDILVYAKQKSNFRFKGMKRDENSGFSNPDNDPRGLWKRQYLQRLGQGLPVRTVIDPATGNKFIFETPYTQEKLDLWIRENRIIFPKSKDNYPARKEFLLEYENEQQLVTSLGLYATKATTEKLYNLFEKKKIFTNPKPDTLLFDLFSYITLDNDIILDFFAGSGTTAHAVMQLNAEDGGNRKFIMVQIDEETKTDSEAFKAGYKTIDKIARERIKRAAKKIKTEKGLALPKDFDGGFRHYRLVMPDVKTLDKIIEFDPKSKKLFDIGMIDQFSYKETKTSGLETLLTTWLIDDGYPFDTKIETKIFADYQSHYIEESATLYLINQDWNTKALKVLLNEIGKNKLIVKTIIVYAYSFGFESMRELKTNIKTNLENPPEIIVRY
ncbi:MAG: site-specific DNA-methyltransferase [Planctomycetaceae bacterium]|jgi:adenine-specific DNA-methyltransferase|nr:site-specific DNA-methyltransferase [Planctomycetaceae bacterium]